MGEDYGARYGAGYEAARGLPSTSIGRWAEVVAERLDGPGALVDLGAGTGRFSSALAERTGHTVIAVEPSPLMQQQAGPAARVHHVQGSAEDLPLADGCAAGVWASQVLHHLTDLQRASSELHRVLAPGGRLFVRGIFSERGFDSVSWSSWFPEAREPARALMSADHYVAALSDAGLRFESHEVHRQPPPSTLRELYERVRLRSDSVLGALADDVFEARLDVLRAAAHADPDRPLTADVELDLLVLVRPLVP